LRGFIICMFVSIYISNIQPVFNTPLPFWHGTTPDIGTTSYWVTITQKGKTGWRSGRGIILFSSKSGTYMIEIFSSLWGQYVDSISSHDFRLKEN